MARSLEGPRSHRKSLDTFHSPQTTAHSFMVPFLANSCRSAHGRIQLIRPRPHPTIDGLQTTIHSPQTYGSLFSNLIFHSRQAGHHLLMPQPTLLWSPF